MLTIQEQDRPPGSDVEPAVDALRFLFHFRHQILVPLDLGPARGADLDKGQVPLVGRIPIKKLFDRAESLENSFCVIDTVNAHAEEGRLNSQAPQQWRSAAAGQFSAARALPAKVDADRKGSHCREVLLAIDGEVFAIDSRF